MISSADPSTVPVKPGQLAAQTELIAMNGRCTQTEDNVTHGL